MKKANKMNKIRNLLIDNLHLKKLKFDVKFNLLTIYLIVLYLLFLLKNIVLLLRLFRIQGFPIIKKNTKINLISKSILSLLIIYL